MSTFHVVIRFQIEPEKIGELKSVVKDFFVNEVNHAQGFVSAKFHENEDQTVFLNYATWESKSAYLKFSKDIAMKSERAKRVFAFNPSADRVHCINL